LVSALRLPPVTAMSPVLPFQAKSADASLSVKVIVAVWPAAKLAWLLLMAMVGAVLSGALASVAGLALPAASWATTSSVWPSVKAGLSGML
jgi:hypothetical protein